MTDSSRDTFWILFALLKSIERMSKIIIDHKWWNLRKQNRKCHVKLLQVKKFEASLRHVFAEEIRSREPITKISKNVIRSLRL